MAKYFYKGFEILPIKDGFVVRAPSYRNKIVKVTKTQIQAKMWIEKIDSNLDVMRAALAVEKILK